MKNSTRFLCQLVSLNVQSTVVYNRLNSERWKIEIYRMTFGLPMLKGHSAQTKVGLYRQTEPKYRCHHHRLILQVKCTRRERIFFPDPKGFATLPFTSKWWQPGLLGVNITSFEASGRKILNSIFFLLRKIIGWSCFQCPLKKQNQTGYKDCRVHCMPKASSLQTLLSGNFATTLVCRGKKETR